MKHANTLAGVSALAFASAALADDVKVGVVVSNTSTYAFVGVPLVNGMKLAAEEITAADGWGGHNVEIVYEDNRSDKQEAIALITRLAQSENADIVIGPIATSEAMATGPLANDLKIPMFTTATLPAVLEIGPYIFKSTETADAYMAPVAEHVVGLEPESCFLVSIRDNEGYIRQRNVFRDIISDAGIEISGDESILASDTDFTALSTKIVAAEPDCLFVTAPRSRRPISSSRPVRPGWKATRSWPAIPGPARKSSSRRVERPSTGCSSPPALLRPNRTAPRRSRPAMKRPMATRPISGRRPATR